MIETVTSKSWIHSCRAKNEFQDFVVVKEKEVTINKDDSSIVSVKNNLRIVEEPKRKIWVTKKSLQNHFNKKEYESIKNCDTYMVKDKFMNDELKNILGYSYRRNYMSLKELCNSPYVYGADVGIESLIRMDYKKKAKHPVTPLVTGGLDIERSVLGDGQINVITVILDKHIYTGVLKEFTHNCHNANGERYTCSKDAMCLLTDQLLEPYIKQYGLTYTLEYFDHELDIIKWIFQCIHKHPEVDFIGIWNMDYDIPTIIERIEYYGENPADIFHNPKIDEKYKYLFYKKDRRQTQHISDKWHWMNNTSYSQFIDAMLLYARLRKNKKKEVSLALDAITTKILGSGKLKFADNAGHHEMQSKYFDRYVVYNMFDAILQQMMFWATKDHVALVELSGVSPLSDFSKQTSMLKDLLYEYYLSKNLVLGTAARDVTELDHTLLPKLGGTVLPVYRIYENGLRILEDHKYKETMCFIYVKDCDFSSMYPNTMIAFNISKETKLFTLISINGKNDPVSIEKFCGGISTPMENAVPLCTEFFNLPSYQEMDKEFAEFLNVA